MVVHGENRHTTTSGQAVISFEQVSFGYDGHTTLSDLTVRLTPGSFHFLTGPSGAGKTTLLKLLYLEWIDRAGGGVLLGAAILLGLRGVPEVGR